MDDRPDARDRITLSTIRGVPKQTRPPRVSKSVRLPARLLIEVEEACAEDELNFTDAVEIALRQWLEGR